MMAAARRAREIAREEAKTGPAVAVVDPAVDPQRSAKLAGLRYVSDGATPGIRRTGAAGRFRYVNPDGRRVTDPAELQRIRALAIPPAWTNVWICLHPLGHVQATGRDARGRKQFRYHRRWREVRDEVKYGRLIAFAQALPALRKKVDADLQRKGLSREKVLAAVVQLLEKTLIRVGNEEYARHNHSFGLTTMRNEHARVFGSTVRFEFRGKSKIEHSVDLRDRRLTRIIKACRDLPGYELFQYLDEDGNRQMIDSADVNSYLRETTGQDFTAKDFRTWAGTVLAAQALAQIGPCSSQAQTKRNVLSAVESVAKKLGNTRSVCRKSYIHPVLLDAYADGVTLADTGRKTGRAHRSNSGLSPEEAAVVNLIQYARRLAKSA